MEQVTLDLIPVGAKTVCHASQYDIGRTIRFNLVNNNQPVMLAGTETIVVKITKTDGTKIEKYLSNTSSTYVDWVTGEGDCDQAGIYNCEIKLTDGSAELGSKNFTIKVEEDPYNGEEVITKTASGDPAVFTTNLVDLFVEIKCNINAIQEGTPWIDSNIVNKEPYLFRKIAGTASRIGNSEFNKIVGGTVAFNQLVQFATGSGDNNGVTFTRNADGTITTSGTATGSAYLNPCAEYNFVNHKILFCGCASGGDGWTYYVKNGYANEPIDTGNGAIANVNGNFVYQIIINTGVDTTGLKFTPQAYDLTAMFGPTIADYIYNLETNTAGAGVAWFRKYYPASYYPYNAVSLKSSIPVAKRVIGKNLLNTASYENGQALGIYLDALVKYAEPSKCSIVKLPLKAGTYTLSHNGTYSDVVYACYYYDNNEAHYINNTQLPFSFTLPTDAYVGITLPTMSQSDVGQFMLNIGSTPLAYEPYKETIIDLGGDTLRGIPELDNNNNLYYYGDIKTSDGIITRKLAVEDLSLIQNSIEYNSAIGAWVVYQITPAKYAGWNGIPNVFDITGKTPTYYGDENRGDNKITTDSAGRIIIGNNSSTNKPDYLVIFERATYTTEQSTAFTNPVSIDANGSEEFVDGNVYELVDLNSLSWALNQGADYWYYYVSLTQTAKLNSLMLAENYEIVNVSSIGYVNNQIAIGDATLYCRTDSIGNIPTGIAIYEKSSSSDVEIPVGHESFYADIYQISGHAELNLFKRGINQWDEQVELGYIDISTGQNVANSGMLRSTNYMSVIPNETYYFNSASKTLYLYYYGYDKSFISATEYVNNSIKTMPDGVYFIRFVIDSTYGTTYNNDISINYSSTDHDYHAYAGELVTVAFGQTVYDAILDVTSGKLRLITKGVDLGSLNWTSTAGIFYTDDITDKKIYSTAYTEALRVDIYMPVINNASVSNMPDMSIKGQVSDKRVYIKNTSYTSSAAFKSAMSGKYLVYELATPVEIQLTAHQLETILGQNILSHDCNGTTEVKYLYNA